MTKAEAITPLFERFDAMLRHGGYIPMSGQIVDASLVAAPRQRNTKAEKADIKAGKIPEAWKDKPDLIIRTIGIKRAEMKIGLANLAYNIRRFIYLERISAA